MATPTVPGTTVGETATAGTYTWRWNGSGWDLQQTSLLLGGGYSFTYLWHIEEQPMESVMLDYV